VEPLAAGVERTAEVLREPGVADRAWPFLDPWGIASRRRIQGEKWKLLHLAGALDPDPFRARIRKAFLDDDRKGLRESALSNDPAASPSTPCSLSIAAPLRASPGSKRRWNLPRYVTRSGPGFP